eukprot:scaffold12069_cov69-Cylindrotheca_fusiformis.AAC.1
MADIDPPPNPDGMRPNPDDMVVGDLSAAVRDLGSGFSLNEYGQRKIHSFKTSLYLSLDRQPQNGSCWVEIHSQQDRSVVVSCEE